MAALSITLKLCVRYVDNRLAILDKIAMEGPAYERFLDALFYEYPVQLEDCGNNKFLGYLLDMEAGTMIFDIPTEPFFYRSIRSAGTQRRILSGLGARLFLLYRGTYPAHLAPAIAATMIQRYVDQGFTARLLHAIHHQVRCKCQ